MVPAAATLAACALEMAIFWTFSLVPFRLLSPWLIILPGQGTTLSYMVTSVSCSA